MALGTFEVHAGDFKPGKFHQLVRDPLYFFGGKHKKWNLVMNTAGLSRETIPLSHILELEIASEESVNKLGGAIGWGIAGEVLLGPIGLLAGLLRGGRGNQVTFVCKLNDGRKFLATAPSSVFSEMRLALATSKFDRDH